MHAFLSLLITWLAALAPAQQSKAKAELFTRTEGDTIRAAIRIKIAPGWHLYHEELGPENAVGLPTTFEFSGDGITWSKVRLPAPEKADQPVGKDGEPTWIFEHHGTIVAYALGKVANANTWSLHISGLTCEDSGSCIPYSAELDGPGAAMPDDLFAKFPADLKLESASAAPVADDFEPFESPEAKAKVELFVREQNGEALAALRVALKPRWHLYHTELGPEDAVGRATRLELGGAGIAWGAPVWPAPKKIDQPVGENGDPTWIWAHEGTFVVYARGTLAGGAEVARATASIKGLTCASLCVEFEARVRSSGTGPDDLFAKFPANATLDGAPVATGAAAVAPAHGDENAAEWSALTFDGYQPRDTESNRSLGVWLLFAFIAGVLLNVMPCVLPVLSIKVLSFVQQAGESKARVFALGLAFSAGILIVFVVLAALAAFAGQGWGAQFQSEAFKITMVAVVFAFSLSLFDVYELGVPSKVGEFAAVRREGIPDAVFKGIMATVLATPCSGPFLGSTLTWALAQPPLVVFAVFITVGLGMAAPYVVLTANPALLKFLPRPGAWMQTFKHAMGFVLLATVVFLMISVRQDNLLFVVLLLVFVSFGCWWWGKFATFEQTTFQHLRTLFVALAIAGFGAWFSFGPLRSSFTGKGSVDWQEFDPAALERFRAEGRPVMIDFTADWCMNCKTNKVLVYESKRISELLERKGVVPVEADRTSNSPKAKAIERFHRKLGSQSIPFLAIFVPGLDWNRPFVFRDLVTIGELVEVLEALPDAPRAQQ